MEKLIIILAWTSFLVSLIPNLFNLTGLFLALVINFLSEPWQDKASITVGWGFFLWLALGIWPVVYYFNK